MQIQNASLTFRRSRLVPARVDSVSTVSLSRIGISPLEEMKYCQPFTCLSSEVPNLVHGTSSQAPLRTLLGGLETWCQPHAKPFYTESHL